MRFPGVPIVKLLLTLLTRRVAQYDQDMFRHSVPPSLNETDFLMLLN